MHKDPDVDQRVLVTGVWDHDARYPSNHEPCIHIEELMNDIGTRENSPALVHAKLVLELLQYARCELSVMRTAAAVPEAKDAQAWQRTSIAAHNIAVRAEALRLGVLQRCASELELLTTAILNETKSGRHSPVELAMIAIETLELELSALESEKRQTPPS